MPAKNKRFHYFILYSVVGLYFLILAALLFFKSGSFQSVNLVPFRFVQDYLIGNSPLAFSNVIGNIVMFIPLGIYISVFNSKKSNITNFLWLILFSAGVELLQYVLKVGATDIDDLILNSLGGLLGIVFAGLLRRLFKDRALYALELLSLLTGVLFISLFLCLHFGAFGFRIRIL